ncbi:hypothetical protein Z962_10970 [Clostridium botulinum C/D str. BKT12695]|nr:hypothetical protein Z962_10970 [Clostridium botulinum C/D str. BKT12695]
MNYLAMKKINYMIGAVSILYYLFFVRFSGVMGFHTIWLFIGIFFIFFKFFKEVIVKSYNALNSKLRFVLKVCISLGIASFIILESLIIYSGISNKNPKSDYIIVLGAAVHGDYMSLILKERVDRSLEYLREYPSTKVIVSGGKGPGEFITEAEAMKRYLVENGVKNSQIIKEENSRTTAENFKYSSKIIENMDKERTPTVSVVTTNFHMLRAKMLAKRSGLKVNGIPARGHISSAPNYYIREYFAFIHSFACDNIN